MDIYGAIYNASAMCNAAYEILFGANQGPINYLGDTIIWSKDKEIEEQKANTSLSLKCNFKEDKDNNLKKAEITIQDQSFSPGKPKDCGYFQNRASIHIVIQKGTLDCSITKLPEKTKNTINKKKNLVWVLILVLLQV